MHTNTLAQVTIDEHTSTGSPTREPHVVIIGAGFAGLRAAQALRHVPVKVTLIDRCNHHLFQPQLYQVAIGALSPADIAEPIRHVLNKQRNVEVLLAEVSGIDTQRRRVLIHDQEISYDYLIVATGAQYNYFGHEEWRQYALSLKSLEDARAIRRSILRSFEAATLETDPEKQRALLTCVVIGGGPAGVEMTSQIAEMVHTLLATDYTQIDRSLVRILLVEAGPRVLSMFPESLSQKARKALTRQGIEVRTNTTVEVVDAEGIVIAGEHLAAKAVIWLAGVKASPAGAWLGAELDRVGHVKVHNDLSIEGHPEVFVIGDAALATQDNAPLPGLAPVAIQEGQYVAGVIAGRIAGKERKQGFHYHNEGKIATVGRFFGVADMGKMQLTGFPAWLIWLMIHAFLLIGFRNPPLVTLRWGLAYVSLRRGARIILP